MFSNIKNPKDFFTGLFLLVVCAIFALGIYDLRVGTIQRPGPGYFPLMLTALQFAFGVAILVNGFRTKGEPIGAIPWRGVIFVTLPVIFFGATLKGLGFVPALALTVLFTSMGSTQWTWRSAIISAIVLVAFSWVVFIWGLGLPVAGCGSWFRTEALLPLGNWIYDTLTAIGISPRFIPVCY